MSVGVPNKGDSLRLVFTMTPGRSGTMLLANLCVLLPGVTSEHEPKPLFSDLFFKLRRDPDQVYPYLKQKKRWIDKLCALDGSHTYIETCHLACKGFFEPMLSLGWKFDVIALKRPHIEVATSLHRIGDIPGRTKTGRKYYLHPGLVSNYIDISGYWEDLTDYQLCYWYCLEIERRVEYYTWWLPEKGVNVCVVQLEELGTLGGFRSFLTRAGLPQPDVIKQRLFDIVTTVQWNYKATRKRCGPGMPDNPREQEADLVDKILRRENKCKQ